MSSPEQYRRYLLNKGLSPTQAEGVLMNIKDESGFNPGINEGNPTVPGSRGGYGLFQHTGPRRRALEAYAGDSVSDWQKQIDFAMTEPDMANYLKQDYSDPGQAAVAFLDKFERPAKQHRDARAAKYLGRPDVRMASNYGGMTTGSTNPMDVTGDPRTGRMNMDPMMMAQMGMLPGMSQYGMTPAPTIEPRNDFLSNPLFQMGAAMAANPSGYGGSALQGLGKGAMAANEAMNQQQRLNADLQRQSDVRHYASQKAMGRTGVPDNIKEIMMLKQMYPHLSDEQVTAMAFTGRVQGTGTEFQKIGERVYRVEKDEFGNPAMEPLGDEEQKDYERVMGEQEKAKSKGEKFGAAHVATIADTSDAYTKTYAQLQNSEQLLDRFKSGEFDGATGAISGRLGQFFDPQTAQVQAKEMSETLANLGVENLAPVSNYEIDLIRRMYASSFMNKDQNIAVLEDLVKVRKAKAKTMKKILNRLKTESIEEYLLDPETIDYAASASATTTPLPPPGPQQAPMPTEAAPVAPAGGVGGGGGGSMGAPERQDYGPITGWLYGD